MYKKPYDLIFSIGDDCACSYYLRQFKLQNASYPFDWIGWAPIDCAVTLIENNFTDFLATRYFIPAYYPNPAAMDKTHDFYKNTKTGMHFAHDFPAGIPPHESVAEVAEKYNRRIARFYQDMNKAKDILFVWLSKTSDIDPAVLIKEHARLCANFSHRKIDWLILENDSSMKSLEFKETDISAHITKIVFDNVSYDLSNPFAEWRGNKENIEAVFKKLRLKTSKTVVMKKCFFRIVRYLCVIIPFHTPRKKLRDAIKLKLLGD